MPPSLSTDSSLSRTLQHKGDSARSAVLRAAPAKAAHVRDGRSPPSPGALASPPGEPTPVDAGTGLQGTPIPAAARNPAMLSQDRPMMYIAPCRSNHAEGSPLSPGHRCAHRTDRLAVAPQAAARSRIREATVG